MSNNRIQTILKDVLEEEIPSSQVNLWPAVKASLVAGKHRLNQQGDKMNTVNPRRLPRFAYAIALFLALLVLFFATPPGRSFAKNVLELFSRAEGTSFPVDDSQIVSGRSEQASPTALPPGPLISVAEAAKQVGFDLAELPYVPEGLEYLGARLYGKYVTIEYQTQDRVGHLIIKQSREGYNQTGWGAVPASDIVPVKIGDLDGEFAQGTFVIRPGDMSAIWKPDTSSLRLRWVNGGVWFEIAKDGDAPVIEYLDMEALIKLAESLTIQP